MSFMTAETARTKSTPSQWALMPFWPKPRNDIFLSYNAPNSGIPRLDAETQRMKDASSTYTIKGPISPFYIPSTYGDPDGQAEALLIVDPDTNTCADLAIRYYLYNDVAAGAKAVDIIVAWSTITVWTLNDGATTPLVWASRMPRLIEAAYLLKDKGHSAYTATVEANFKAMLQRSINAGASPTALGYTNNVGVWGTVFDIATAKFLNNRASMENAIGLWRQFFDANVVNNIPINEVYREGGTQGDGSTGLWYSNFLVYAFTIAAEWARYSGEWIYDHTGPDGSTFEGLAKWVRYYTRHPEEFPYNSSGKPSVTIRSLPHDEILHALWPNEDSQWIINNFPNTNDRDSHGLRGAVMIYRNRPLYG